METTLFYGLDLGIKTGSLIRAGFDDCSEITDAVIISSWLNGPHSDSNLPGINKWFHDNVFAKFREDLSHYPLNKAAVGIDWTPKNFGKTRKVHLTLKAYIAGQFVMTCITSGVIPVLLSPAEVRRSFALKDNARKTVVQNSFLKHYDVPWDAYNDNDLDALILATIVCQLAKIRENSLPIDLNILN